MCGSMLNITPFEALKIFSAFPLFCFLGVPNMTANILFRFGCVGEARKGQRPEKYAHRRKNSCEKSGEIGEFSLRFCFTLVFLCISFGVGRTFDSSSWCTPSSSDYRSMRLAGIFSKVKKHLYYLFS